MIVSGLGALLVTEMSNAGNLFTPSYTAACVDLGEQKKDVVVGFIAQSRVSKVNYYFGGFIISRVVCPNFGRPALSLSLKI